MKWDVTGSVLESGGIVGLCGGGPSVRARRRGRPATCRMLVAAAAPAAIAAFSAATGPAASANTVYLFASGGASLDLTTNYTPTAVFGSSADLVIGQSSFTSTRSDYTGGYSQSITAGSIDDLSTFAITVDNKAAGNTSSYVLGGTGNAGNSVANGSSSTDLLYVATGGSLTFTNYSSGTTTVVLNQSGGTFDVAGTGSLTFSSALLTGAYGFTKTGTGTLLITGLNNTFTGGVTLAAGVLQISGGSSLGAAPASGTNLTFSGNSTLQFNANVPSVGIGGTRGFVINSGVTGTIDTQSYSYSLGNAVTGSGSLTKIGTGTLALSGNDTYTGATTVSAGTLQFNSSTAFTTSALTANITGTLSLGTSAALASTVPLTLNAGTLALVAGRTTGTTFASTTIGGNGSSGITFGVPATTATVALGTLARGTGSGTLDINPSAGTSVTTTTANGTGTGNTGAILGGYLTYGGGVSFAANDGSGNVIALPTAAYGNSYATATTGTDFDATTTGTFANATINSLRFNAGTATTATTSGSLTVGSGGVLVTPGTAGVTSTLAGGTVTSGNGLDLIFHEYGGTLLVTSGVVDASASTALNKAGPGTVILDGSNTYTGGTVIGAGTLQVGNGDTSGNLSTAQVTDYGTLTFNRTDVVSSTNFVTGTGNLVMNGTGTLALGQSDNYSGGTTINAGVIQFGTTNNAGTGGFTFNGGTVRETTSLSSGRTFTFNAGGGTVDNSNGATFSLSGILVGTGPVTFNGATTTSTTGAADTGTVAVSGVNTYTGGTTVAAGTLRANTNAGVTNSSTGSGAVTVATGALLAGSGYIVNTAGTITINGSIGAGSSTTTIGTLTTGSETWNGGGNFLSKFNASTPATGTFDKLVMSSLTINATSTSPFSVTLSNTSTGVSVAAGTKIVLADDTDTTAANPFNVSGGTTFASLTALQQALTLNAGSAITGASGSLQLDTTPDGTGGEDLVLDSVTATPEPASLLLLGATVAPLALGRRRARQALRR